MTAEASGRCEGPRYLARIKERFGLWHARPDRLVDAMSAADLAPAQFRVADAVLKEMAKQKTLDLVQEKAGVRLSSTDVARMTGVSDRTVKTAWKDLQTMGLAFTKDPQKGVKSIRSINLDPTAWRANLGSVLHRSPGKRTSQVGGNQASQVGGKRTSQDLGTTLHRPSLIRTNNEGETNNSKERARARGWIQQSFQEAFGTPLALGTAEKFLPGFEGAEDQQETIKRFFEHVGSRRQFIDNPPGFCRSILATEGGGVEYLEEHWPTYQATQEDEAERKRLLRVQQVLEAEQQAERERERQRKAEEDQREREATEKREAERKQLIQEALARLAGSDPQPAARQLWSEAVEKLPSFPEIQRFRHAEGVLRHPDENPRILLVEADSEDLDALDRYGRLAVEELAKLGQALDVQFVERK